MYFSENLETCTIRYVSFCEGGVSLFYFFGGDGTDRAGLGGGCIPRRWRPQPPVHPERLHITGSRAGHARCKADHARHDTHARTLDTLRLSAPDTRQTIVSAAGLDCPRSASGKVYNFGRFILSIFIWIYFAKSIDNPYIYGYNIISPDKYGLQPQYTKTGGQKP